jgi:uncharacterized protein
MAVRKIRRIGACILVAAFTTLAAALALPWPAQAQFFGGGWGWGYQQPYRRPPPPSHNFFSFPFFSRPPAYAPPAESYHAPPPRKLETQPATTVVVVGDSMADWLAYGLEEIYADNPQIGVVRNVRLNSGLVRYEPRNETLEWSQAIKDVLATEKPAAIVVMLGLNDRLPLRSPQPGEGDKSAAQPTGGPQKPGEQQVSKAEAAAIYEFRTDGWAKLYGKRIDDMIAALKSKGVPVLWVGLPALRGTRSTGDMSYLDDLYHAAADKAGITYVDIWDGFVDENGRYSVEGPDFEGQIRRLRTSDGVHFTKFGALKLAHLVDQELGHILANPAAPVAAATPQASAPAKLGTTRPAIGPVLPLTASGGGGDDHLNAVEGSNLLGGDGHPTPIASEDPTAKSVLVRGDPLAAPSGRADDFAWPPPGAEASTASPAAPAPAGAH